MTLDLRNSLDNWAGSRQAGFHIVVNKLCVSFLFFRDDEIRKKRKKNYCLSVLCMYSCQNPGIPRKRETSPPGAREE